MQLLRNVLEYLPAEKYWDNIWCLASTAGFNVNVDHTYDARPLSRQEATGSMNSSWVTLILLCVNIYSHEDIFYYLTVDFSPLQDSRLNFLIGKSHYN